ncbi:MAG: hypothetical protein R2815_09905 [Flavobacteriales bacterium]
MMNVRTILSIPLLTALVPVAGQNVGINPTGAAPAASAMLDVTSTNSGLLIPRIALTSEVDVATIPAAANSLLVYNTATAGAGVNAVTPGYYYWLAAPTNRWIKIAADEDAWKVLGNANTTAAGNFLGTTDNNGLRIRTFNFERFEVTTGTGTATGTGGRLQAFMNGTAASPIYSWSTSPGMGLFSQAANVLGVSTGGVERFRVPNANQVHAMADGTAALPFYSWGASTGLGLWRPAANVLGFSSTGLERMRILANGQVVVAATAPFAGDQFSSFGNATNTFAISGYSGANGAGVYGQGVVGSGDGVYGIASAPGISGWGGWFRNLNAASGNGVVGSGNNQNSFTLATGSGGAFTGLATGSYHYTLAPGVAQGQLIQDAFAAQWNVGYWSGAQYFKIIGNGIVSTVVRNPENQRVTMYCPEAPEVLFQDYGVGKLVNGHAVVVLEPTLSMNLHVDEDHPLKVFVQLEGDCNGVYVTNKSADGFEVHELGGGTSNVEFSWSIVGNRAGETYTNGQGITRTANYLDRFGPAPEILERNERVGPELRETGN